MSKLEGDDDIRPTFRQSSSYTIPGIKILAEKILAASNSGVLFFLADEMDALLDSFIREKGHPPMAAELEAIIAQAAQRLIDKH